MFVILTNDYCLTSTYVYQPSIDFFCFRKCWHPVTQSNIFYIRFLYADATSDFSNIEYIGKQKIYGIHVVIYVGVSWVSHGISRRWTKVQKVFLFPIFGWLLCKVIVRISVYKDNEKGKYI